MTTEMAEEPEKFGVSTRQYPVGGMQWPHPLPPSKQQLTMPLSEIVYVVHSSHEVGDAGVDDPEILGSLAKVDALKENISCGKHQCDTFMPFPFGTVIRGAQRVERRPPRKEGTET